jgi:hypothetical protein
MSGLSIPWPGSGQAENHQSGHRTLNQDMSACARSIRRQHSPLALSVKKPSFSASQSSFSRRRLASCVSGMHHTRPLPAAAPRPSAHSVTHPMGSATAKRRWVSSYWAQRGQPWLARARRLGSAMWISIGFVRHASDVGGSFVPRRVRQFRPRLVVAEANAAPAPTHPSRWRGRSHFTTRRGIL